MPRTGGTGAISNQDPLSIFNAPAFDAPVNTRGTTRPAGDGLFDAFVPAQQHQAAPPQVGNMFPPTNYTQSAPAPVNTRGTINYGSNPTALSVAQANAAALLGGRVPDQSMGFSTPYEAPQPMGNFGTTSFAMPPMQPYAPSSSAQWLAGLGQNNQYLQNFAQNGQPVQLQNPYLAQFAQGGVPTSIQGSYLDQWAKNGQPVDAMPAWQSYVDAMQRNNQSGAANLMEMFNGSGGYQSTSFGNAAVDYQTQTSKDQNALLAQMGYQSLSDALGRQFQAGGTYDTLQSSLAEAAKGRQLQAGSLLDQLQFQGNSDAMMRQYGAAQTLGNQAFQGASQLAGYDFNSQMAQYEASLQAAMAAANSANSLQGNATSMLGTFGNSAANSLLSNSLSGTNALFGGSQNALSSMFGANNNALAQLLQNYQTQQGQGVQGYQTLINSYLQNLGLGSQMGSTQYNTLQGQLGALYQEWMRTQPQYNPLLPYMFQGATGYVPIQQTSTPSFADYFTQILGSGIGAAGSILGGILSDERTKENVVPVGEIKGVPFYEYEYVGFPGKHIGVLAQEVASFYPAAVGVTPEGTYLVDYKKLASEMMLKGGVN